MAPNEAKKNKTSGVETGQMPWKRQVYDIQVDPTTPYDEQRHTAPNESWPGCKLTQLIPKYPISTLCSCFTVYLHWVQLETFHDPQTKLSYHLQNHHPDSREALQTN
jgi:hypothetical protein